MTLPVPAVPPVQTLVAAALAALMLLAVPGRAAAQQRIVVAATSLADLSLEELASVPVTSVAGRPQPASQAAASIVVITREDIRRSTATSLPEALRLAPNLHVARLNAGQWAISARGFNNSIGNKLLVLVDGRTVYSPLYSGVFWEAQKVPLGDIERIEVVSGPGGTLWGTNAVNGVINVVTRSAAETTGPLAVLHAGETGRRALLRYGAPLGERGGWRIWGVRDERDETIKADTGAARGDALDVTRVGTRADWQGAGHTAMVQAEAFRGGGTGLATTSPRLSGGHVLARWTQAQADGGSWQLQAYVDRSRHHERVFFDDVTELADVDFSHVPARLGDHRLIWGVGHRQAKGRTLATPLVRFIPERRTLRWTSVFVQDQLALSPGTELTLGLRAERNVYTGTEWLPTLRLSHDLGEGLLAWGSLSRAVRAPARLDREFFFPADPPYFIAGGPEFRSEIATVAEFGLRGRATEAARWSATLFHHDFERLRAGTAGATTVLNLAEGRTWGLEAWGTVDLSRRWRLSGGLSTLHKDLRAAPQAGANSVANLGNDPKRQAMLRLSGDLTASLQVDTTLRHVGALPNPAVPSHTVADIRIGWSPAPSVELSLLATNAFDREHAAFNTADASRFGREAWLRLSWRLP
jgi:iron complex outermembrane receptor protein